MKPVNRLHIARIVAVYVGLAIFWIAGSDYLTETILRRPGIHTYKGIAFVLVTGALLYFVLRSANTSMRNFEKESLASREQFRRVIEHAPEAIFIQVEGNFDYLNPAALKLFGAAAPEQLLGTPVLDHVHEGGREIARVRIRALRLSPEPMPSMEQRFIRIDGSIADVDVSAAPFERSGEHGAIVFVRDISERKSAERQKRNLEEQVRQAQKLESVGRLAGGVAHDFNNLLTVINGYSDMLLTGLPGSSPEFAFLREIRDAGERAAGLTAQLLTFSRKHPSIACAVEVNPMVREVSRMLSRLVGDHISILTELDPEVGSVLADPTSLNQLVMNLVVNARDAMPNGGGVVIRTSAVLLSAADCESITGSTPGEYILLSVSDNGQGIPLENQSRIFEPFFTTKGETRGTGLGLSTVYGIVRNAGGWIHVESMEGEGTTMRIWLPSHCPSELNAEDPLAVSVPGGTETILLVEDDPAVRHATQTMLTRLGYRVLSAEGGFDAIEIIRRPGAGIDIVLSDVMMPRMTGPQLVHRLREENHTLKVLLMSGYRDEETTLSRPDSDIPCIAKPFPPQLLARRVREVLDGTVI